MKPSAKSAATLPVAAAEKTRALMNSSQRRRSSRLSSQIEKPTRITTASRAGIASTTPGRTGALRMIQRNANQVIAVATPAAIMPHVTLRPRRVARAAAR